VATDDEDDAAPKKSPAKTAPKKRRPPVARKKRTASRTPSNTLIGTFKASPDKGVQIELTLRNNQAFTWKFTANGKTQAFSGKYQISPNSLLLTRSDGEAMDGTLERTGNGGFKFRMKKADSDDPGLTFAL
jgi:hypothetical protein